MKSTNVTVKQHSWSAIFKAFKDSHAGRPTRLGIFEPTDDSFTDYWIEDGLPLIGLSIDQRPDDLAVDIELEGYNHNASGIVKATVHLSASGIDDGIDLIEGNGRTTLLRFEQNL